MVEGNQTAVTHLPQYPGEGAHLWKVMQACADCVQTFVFLSFSLSRMVPKWAFAMPLKSLRRPLARAPKHAAASATHTTLLSLTSTCKINNV